MWSTRDWSALVDGTGCPICVEGPRDVLLDLGSAWLTAPAEAPLPGYACLIAKRHVVEPFELAPEEGHALWDALVRVSRGLRDATGAVKLNYEIHGNTIPHLHVHLYPRFRGDPFEGRPIDTSATTPFQRTEDDLQRLRRSIDRVAG